MCVIVCEFVSCLLDDVSLAAFLTQLKDGVSDCRVTGHPPLPHSLCSCVGKCVYVSKYECMPADPVLCFHVFIVFVYLCNGLECVQQ